MFLINSPTSYAHVISDYERPYGILRTTGFHETICELASVFTLRRMAESWPSCPPFSNLVRIRRSHWTAYAEERLSRKEHQLPDGSNSPFWLKTHQPSLRKDLLSEVLRMRL